MSDHRSMLRVEVWARNAQSFYFETVMPLVIPRVGERVEFEDGYGIVDEVVWVPDRSRRKEADMLVKVFCAPEKVSLDG